MSEVCFVPLLFKQISQFNLFEVTTLTGSMSLHECDLYTSTPKRERVCEGSPRAITAAVVLPSVSIHYPRNSAILCRTRHSLFSSGPRITFKYQLLHPLLAFTFFDRLPFKLIRC